MKKRLIKIGVASLCVIVFLVCIGFFRNMVNPVRVAKIELHTYDHQNKGHAELTGVERLTLITLYNLSRCAGDVNAEPCCDSYGIDIHFHDGSRLYLGEGVRTKLILRSEENCYMDNFLLINYIYTLAGKYELPIE